MTARHYAEVTATAEANRAKLQSQFQPIIDEMRLIPPTIPNLEDFSNCAQPQNLPAVVGHCRCLVNIFEKRPAAFTCQKRRGASDAATFSILPVTLAQKWPSARLSKNKWNSAEIFVSCRSQG